MRLMCLEIKKTRRPETKEKSNNIPIKVCWKNIICYSAIIGYELLLHVRVWVNEKSLYWAENTTLKKVSCIPLFYKKISSERKINL